MQQFDVVCYGGRVGTARTRCLWHATLVRDESCGRHGYAAPLIYAIGDLKAENRPEPLRPPPYLPLISHCDLLSLYF